MKLFSLVILKDVIISSRIKDNQNIYNKHMQNVAVYDIVNIVCPDDLSTIYADKVVLHKHNAFCTRINVLNLQTFMLTSYLPTTLGYHYFENP